ncbi:glycosyltransferase [Cyanobacterium stanieri LEGE 03274]|uniref:Glycosyltransferase n=1 Tax=Cyanobacterium stanieri LEGE 03274 TaxID=1828756 RepID=A0ABR9V5T8_9CHRO|nr:glycosyltransferase [Cyanobacterium stanieri]MBE9223250.1 glycosyltransferase [Cyanobacterium stanieri LEGE 03274]
MNQSDLQPKLNQANQYFNQQEFSKASQLYLQLINENPQLKSNLSIRLAHCLILEANWQQISGNLIQGINYLSTSGWLNSLFQGKPVNAESKPIPWYTYPAIEFLEDKIKPDSIVFEFGGGNSTLWWASKAKQVISIESDQSWYDQIKQKMPDNVQLNLEIDEKKYADFINQYPDQYFDVVIVDGINRNNCLETSLNKLKHNGLLIFDNTDRYEYDKSINLLLSLGFKKIDFYGLIPSYTYKNCTSIFFKSTEILETTNLPSNKQSCLGKSCMQITNPRIGNIYNKSINDAALKNKKILYSHHWSINNQRQPILSENEIYITSTPQQKENVINLLHIGSEYEPQKILKQHQNDWQPDLFIAKVDSFFNVIPRNIQALNCPKVLILGDTQHGNQPLEKMIQYAKSEKYDFYITDHKRHHLWYYHLAGLKNLYWLPGLFLNPLIDNSESQNFEDPSISPNLFKDKVIFVGQASKFHPRRKAILEYLQKEIPNFWYGRLSQKDSLKAYSQALISLNISLNGDLNLRFFEIISSGGFLLTDRLSEESGMNLLFSEGEEYETFSNVQQLVDKVKYFLQYPELVEQYKQKAYQKYLNNYTPKHLAEQLQNIMEGKPVNDIFTVKTINRIKYLSGQGYSQSRIQIYQIIQDFHKYSEKLKIFVDNDNQFCHIEDFLDLPRVKIYLSANSNYLKNELYQYLLTSKTLHAIELLNDKYNNSYDILIVSKLILDIFLQGSKSEFLIISQDQSGLSNIRDFIENNYNGFTINVTQYIDFLAIHVNRENVTKNNVTGNLKLTNTNYLITPDWQSDEETLTEELYNLISTLAHNSPLSKGDSEESNPNIEREDIITLVIDTTGITEEDANLFLSGIAMNLMMEEELDLESILNFTFIDNLEESQWQKILPKITAKITLNSENQDIVNNKLFDDVISIMADGNNYVIMPDWSKDEQDLFNTFSEILINISSEEKATLLIDTNNSNEEEVGLFVSEVVMTLMLEKGIELSEGINVNFVKFTPTQWHNLEGFIKEKIISG